MFLCSLRYFANVPLFPKTPGRPSSLATLVKFSGITETVLIKDIKHSRQIKICIADFKLFWNFPKIYHVFGTEDLFDEK